jgi:hypothetical protein
MTEYGDGFFWLPLSERVKYSKNKRKRLLDAIEKRRKTVIDKIKKSLIK